MRILLYLAVLLCLAIPVAAQPTLIVTLGDSNFDTPGLTDWEMYAARLEKALKAKGHAVAVKNAGIRGDTTQGVLNRLDNDVPPEARIALLSIGVNDALVAKISRETIAANLRTIVSRLRARHVELLIFGIGNPTAPDCCAGRQLAENTGSLFYPNFQYGVVEDVSLHVEKFRPGAANFGTRAATAWHLNAAGNDYVVGQTLPLVERLLARVAP